MDSSTQLLISQDTFMDLIMDHIQKMQFRYFEGLINYY